MPRPKFSHFLEYGAYRTFETGLRFLSVRTTVSMGEFLGRLAYRLLPKYRRLVLRNLRFAFGETKSPEEIHDLVLDVFERNGGNFLSAIRLPLLPKEKLRKHVTFRNLELIFDAIAQKKGIILLSPHMGNWELLAQTITLVDHDATIGAFYRPLNNLLMDRLIKKRRSRQGLQLFAKHASSHKLTTFLREQGVLGILADQRVGSRGRITAFFGRPTTFSPLPAVLAKRSGAPIIGVHCLTTGPDHWEVHFTTVTENTTQACADNLEAAWRSAPADVFWFQDRWRLTSRYGRPLAFLDKSKRLDLQRITKPLRFLLLHEAHAIPSLSDLPHSNHMISWEMCSINQFDPNNLPLLDLIVTWGECSLPEPTSEPVFAFEQLF